MKSTRLLHVPALLALAASALLACSSSGGEATPAPDTGTPPADGGPDTVVVDTGKPDTGTADTKPAPDAAALCDQDLPSGFVCAAPKKTPGSSACTEAALQAFLDACVTSDFKPGSACATWRTTYADCNTCILSWIVDPKSDPAKVYPDTYKCYWSVFPDACGKTVSCSYDCQDKVCAGCDTTAGTGANGTASEWEDCTARAIASSPKGKCWDVAAKDVEGCFTATDTKPCDNDEYWYPSKSDGTADLALLRNGTLVFYRGACRDGGDWSKSSSTGGDAGVTDAGSETSVPDGSTGG